MTGEIKKRVVEKLGYENVEGVDLPLKVYADLKEGKCQNCGHIIIFIENEDFPKYNRWEHYHPIEEDTWVECFIGNCGCTEPKPKGVKP